MSEPSQTTAASDKRPGRRTRLRRVVRHTLYAKAGLVALLAIVTIGVYARLVLGPVSLNEYTGDVGRSLAARIGPGWTVRFGDTALELDGVRPAIRAAGLEIRNPVNVPVVRAPLALVSLDPLALLTGNVSARAIELRDLQLRAIVGTDGSLSFIPAGDGEPLPSDKPKAAGEPRPPLDEGSPVSQALVSLLQPVLSSNGIVGALDRAVVSNARLTLVGADGRERVGFSKLGARFESIGPGRRQIALDLEGSHGAWHVGGTAQEDGRGTQTFNLSVSDVPLTDVLLLAGLSGMPDGSNLKLSAEVSASVFGRRLTSLGGRFWSNAGTVELPDKDLRFLHIERLAGAAAWDESKRVLALSDLTWAGAGTDVRLTAELKEASEPHAWTMNLMGQDAVLGGATPSDPPIKIDRIAGRVRFRDSGMSLEGLSVLGQDLDAQLSGQFEFDRKHLRAALDVKRTNARKLVRLWPETINPDLRRYVSANLKAGTVEALHLTTLLDGPDLDAAFGAKPVSDGAVALSGSLSNGTLTAADGLPPLVALAVDGSATGTTATLSAREARIELPEGRRLRLTDGSYRQVAMTAPGSIARIGFRLGGGADALAALLRLPSFRDATAFDVDPANVKGKVDLRVELPLQLDRLPRNAGEVAAVVTGTISELAVDKVYGREKLEGGTFTLSSDPALLSLRGEAKISGSPTTIELRQPRAGPGELVLVAMLDEAARSRRALPSAPQLSGPVQVKVTAPFGGPAGRSVTRIEADLTRASVDGLLPGWTKPAGKAGRLTFSLNDGDARDLRDVTLDSAPVQVRGNLVIGDDGLERADLSSLKLSVGDDMRAQIEHTGGVYRVTVRGNVADARPLIKQVTSGPGPGANAKGRDGADKTSDLDLDIALNILTGHNDESMTGVVGKVSLRKGELRALQFDGRFRAATLDAQLARREGTSPLLTLKSGDAGAALRFLDVYKRMVGGRLALNAGIGGAAQSGVVRIDEFALKNEPALKRIIMQGPTPTGSDDRASSQGPRADADQVYFTKLVAGFERSQNRIDYKDVVIYGAQVGFTLSGFVDTGRDRTDISGTFIPAYGLNNAFSQVPIVGLILGGGNRNEGLFAVDFRISGPATSPTLNVNPLSAVAPGILRKFFGWAMPDGEDVPTGTTLPHRGER